MTLKPQVALESIAALLQRTPLSTAESIGAQTCIDTLVARLKQADEMEADKAKVSPATE